MQKNCEYFEELLSKAVDGDLSDAEKAELDMHLEECPQCRELYNIYSITYGDSAVVTPPEELLENVMSALPDMNRLKKLRRLYFGLAAAACACLLLTFVPKLLPGSEIRYGANEIQSLAPENEADGIYLMDNSAEVEQALDNANGDASLNESIKEEKAYGSQSAAVFYLDELPEYISLDGRYGSSVIYVTFDEYQRLLEDGYKPSDSTTSAKNGFSTEYTLIYSE